MSLLPVLLAVGLSQGATENWFDFAPANEYGPSAIGMEAWFQPLTPQDAIRLKEDRYVTLAGRTVKFWGVNNSNANCAPSHEAADRRVARFAKYGVNAVRLHKFTYHGEGSGIGDATHSTALEPKGLERLDYYLDALQKKGIYFGWSHIYGHHLRPGDRKRVLAYDEVMSAHEGHLKGSTYGLVNFAPDLQKLSIELTVNMLKHRNSYTGRTFAEEPGLAFIEFQNEDDIFFPSTQAAVEKSPTYKKLLCQLFSDWLVRKYGSEKRFLEAWGPRALNAYPEFQKNESLAAKNIYPIAHFWWYGQRGLKDQSEAKGVRQRLLDSAQFLYDTQNAFYTRFAKAVREAGYEGPLVGSCWQAGDGISHYYNLRSDFMVGAIDRHNYFGGQDAPMKPGPLDNRSQLALPGSGILGTGMQQVKNRPFVVSEWSTVAPNEWGAETPAIVAAYGMGLQGWDGSFQFANDVDRFRDTVALPNGWGVWNVDLPSQIGLYPVLSRMVLRGDIREARPLPARKVSLEDLRKGELPFADTAEQEGDRKEFRGIVPPQALAFGKVEVEFVRESQPAPLLPRIPQDIVPSPYDQLRWVAMPDGKRGYFTIDTSGTQGFVGFSSGRTFSLSGSTIKVDSPFAVVVLTAMDPAKNLRNDKRALLAAVARVHNTGMRYSVDGSILEEVGTSPLRMEPVSAEVTLVRPPKAVNILDHDGKPTGRTVPLEGAKFAIDGARDKAMYYEIVFE
ncbi:MAG TPA: hypothetical protein VGE01_11140 [Fimbriimonas sp.]